MQRFFEHNVLMIGLPGAVDKVLKSVKNKKSDSMGRLYKLWLQASKENWPCFFFPLLVGEIVNGRDITAQNRGKKRVLHQSR
jgi:hypothetical protein